MPVNVHPCGYGYDTQRVLGEVVAAAKEQDSLAPVTLLVPSGLAGTLVRRALARQELPGRSGVAGLTVLTFDRLAELLAAPGLTAQGRRPATGPVLSAAWRRALDVDPGLFDAVAQHPATVTALVRAHEELRGLSEQAMTAVAATGALTADVVRLSRAVAQTLRPDWYDAADLRAAAVAVLDDPAASRELGTVVVVAPQDLDPGAADVVAALAEHRHVDLVLSLTGEARSDAAPLALLSRLDVQAPAARPVPAQATRVRHASDSDDEVRLVVRDVVATLATTPAHRVAVLYASAVPYARLLHDHLAAAHVKLNGPGVRPTLERAHPRALLLLLELAEAGLDRGTLFRLLSTAPLQGDDGRLVPGARWERLSRRAGVVAEADWGSRLRRHAAEQRARAAAEEGSPSPREWLVDRHLEDADEAERLLAFVEGLQVRLQRARAARGWAALSAAGQELFGLLGGEEGLDRLPGEERRAAEATGAVLRGLQGLDALEPGAELHALREVLELELGRDRPRIGRSGTGVLVAPLSAAVALDVDHVFVVGLAEGLYPSRLREDALLPDRARAAAGGQLPALRERLDRQHRHLGAALASAPTVTASFPRGDLRRSGERLPSRWLLPSLRALTGAPELQTTDWQEHADVLAGSPSYAAGVTTAPLPATSQEWRLRTLSAGVPLPDDAVLSAATSLLRARHSATFTRYDGDLRAFAGALPDPADGVRTISPTALEHWVSCPHAYFLQRVLRVEPVEQPEEVLELSPADRGTVMHEALDRFFRSLDGAVPAPAEPWSETHRQALLTFGEQVADEFEQAGLTGHPTLWARDRAALLDDLRQVLDRDQQVRAAEGRRQLRSELSFGRKGVPPVRVELDDGRVVLLAGSADRVDEREDGFLVVTDYKAGNHEKFTGLSEADPDRKGSKLQLPAYAYAARQALDRPDAGVRAEYWFIGPKGRGKQIGYDLTPEVEARYRAVLTTVIDGISGGVFPANVPEDRAWSAFVACAYCDPDGLGAKERRVQWQRKKPDAGLKPYLDLVDTEQEQP